MDTKMIMENLNRADSDVPLTSFGIFPKVDMVKLRQNMELPEQFLRACTLREGTWIVVLTLNSVAAMLIAFLAMLIIKYPDETTAWWKERFRDDFDYYYRDENLDLIDRLYPLWLPISYVIIGVKSVYFVTGLMVMYALVRKTVDPCWYIPWLIVTGLLVAVQWLMAAIMIICLFILMTYRDVTVTWDAGPICCVIVYAVMWSYSWFVVIAHHRRRRIVKYWRQKQRQMGTDVMGPQY